MIPSLENFKASFGPHLQQLRQQHGLTTSMLAKKVEMSCHYIERMEEGLVAPRVETLLALADALKIHPRKLFP